MQHCKDDGGGSVAGWGAKAADLAERGRLCSTAGMLGPTQALRPRGFLGTAGALRAAGAEGPAVHPAVGMPAGTARLRHQGLGHVVDADPRTRAEWCVLAGAAWMRGNGEGVQLASQHPCNLELQQILYPCSVKGGAGVVSGCAECQDVSSGVLHLAGRPPLPCGQHGGMQLLHSCIAASTAQPQQRAAVRAAPG